MKDEELQMRLGDKAARKEMKHELSKAKKSLREKEKEIGKLKLEASTSKKTNLENNSFTTKEASSQPLKQETSSEKQDS